MSAARTIPYQVLITAGLLLVLEGLARIAYTVHLNLAKEAEWYVLSPDVGWDRRPHFSGIDDCSETRSFDGRGLVASDGARLQQKREGQFRALFLGDSNTYGHCLMTQETFVEVASRLLPRSASINLGMSGYTSYQGYKSLLKYGPLIDPSIVFISFNFNDRRLVLQPEQADSDAAFQRLYSSNRINHWSEVSYLFGAAKIVSNWLRPPSPGASGFMPEVRLDQVRPRVDAQGYRENLTKMVQWAKQRGIAVAFILLGDNPHQSKSLREGVKHLSEKNYEQAIKSLTAAKDEDNSFDDEHWFSALAQLHLSKAYKGAGLHDQADRALSLTNAVMGVQGGYPIVLDTEYHAIMKEVAAEHGVPVIDAAAELSKIEGVYFDFCHFDAKGHELVGRLVAGVMKAANSAQQRERITPAGDPTAR